VTREELGEGMRAILLSGAIALFISLLGTRVAINQFRRLGWGQQIRDAVLIKNAS